MTILRLIRAEIECWWHCLTHFHRRRYHMTKTMASTRGWRLDWLGCGDCGKTFYGYKPKGMGIPE